MRSRDISHVNQPVSIIIINALHLHHHWPPSPPSPLPPHHHLHNMSKHGYNGRNTPATTPRHRDAPKDTNQPQRVENAPDATRDRAEGVREGRGARKGQRAGGVQGTPAISFFKITFTDFPFSQTGSPSTEHQNTPEWGVIWCSAASPTF